ncbi:MAG: aspartate--tRNA ligase [Candidatus Doudnabacteria bacterium CG10_big_fil_rev_8_21_14_0_10_41_10]|uniref:Aspartate--tRNA(Asp/Asn) ligase n=1 Tax=Candidatus Doudnabacteria bacterium CG10_big_fil_rev_8_21_14_0_10_41_10 TaxID=1974551 RepID=A0A2H0VFI7_9BACT|nr:MAG: aspartate--tRNA ligase [Candidatus Doudnabacteria bacterium CG10_big_fil_rev_8_21_14_0_10_41_10]
MQRTLIFETLKQTEKEVTIKGWVAVRRDHGKLIFLDIRDVSGLIQVVVNPKVSKDSHKTAEKLRSEFVVAITGKINKRPEKLVNKDLETGSVEMIATKIEILSEAKNLPFEIPEADDVKEETRLKYRYLDLRSKRMSYNMKMRSEMMHFVRNYLHDKGFIEFHTPILSKSTPEGARDYLVPSRKFPGKFFALPQSPQQYKQMLQVAGFDKYFQIAPCFRDEDARADRSPGEFYQVDMEMSFVTQEDILNITEEMFTKMVRTLWPEKKMTFDPWPRLDYAEVMEKYKTDKPDLRKNKEDINELAFAFVVNFPLFAPQAKDKNSEDHFHGAKSKWAPSHHMFTAPKTEDIPMLDTDPGKVKSYQHDLVLNGLEVGGGSVRIHDSKLQNKIFGLIGFDDEDKKKFEHLLQAFEYGVPPHGGIAPGFDRLLSVILGEKSIREVIAFPLMAEARDPLMDAPSEVTNDQLKELHIKTEKPKLKSS